MNVYKLTEEQRLQLIGQTYDGVTLFNTDVYDAEGNPYIGIEEYERLTLVRAVEIGVDSWWINLPLIPYNPIEQQLH